MITNKFKEAIQLLVQHLPEWAKDKEMQILVGGELLVNYVQGDRVKIKKVRCNNCGLCCFDYPGTVYGDDEEGKCKALHLDRSGNWVCTVWLNRPFNCLADPLKEDAPECVIEYE